jgi:hypothetical protein
MRPKLQKQSALKFAGRIMPPSGGEQSREAEGMIPSSLLRNVSKTCFGVHTRDLQNIIVIGKNQLYKLPN